MIKMAHLSSEELTHDPVTLDSVKMYNMVVHFKERLTRIFMEKGLVSECSQLEGVNITRKTLPETASSVCSFSTDVICVFKLITDIVCAVMLNKVKSQSSGNGFEDKYTQTDLILPSTRASTVKKEKGNEDFTNKDDEDIIYNHTDCDPSPPTDLHPPLRRSSRSSVLNRKTLKPGKRQLPVRCAKSKQGMSTKAQSSSSRKVVAKTNGKTEEEGDEEEEEEKEDLKTFSCPSCSESFTSPQALSRHQKTHLDVKETLPHTLPNHLPPSAAPTCQSQPAPETENGEKQEMENSDNELDAPQSEDMSVNHAYDVEDVKKENAEMREQGDENVLSSVTKGSMGSMFQLTAEGLYRCMVCEQETKDRSNMRKHVLKWHAGEPKYRCTKCPKVFTYPESLKFHQKVHVDPSTRAFERTPQGVYRCKQCGRECRNRSNIVKHVNRKHLKAGEKPYKCSLCPAVFGYPRSLKRHELVHEGVRPYRCSQCDKSFFDPTSLRTHSRVHTNDRPYVCQICGNRFRQKEGLKGHMRSHTGDRPYVCERCGMAFAAKRSLTRHIRVHTGERPYPCDQCVAAFADWTTLHNHKLVHRQPGADDPDSSEVKDADGQDAGSENKPYQCQFCGIRYQQSLSLKRHLRIHSSSSSLAKSASKRSRKRRSEEGEGEESTALHLQYRPYQCELCGETFKHLRGYNTHKSKHQNGTLTVRKSPGKRLKRERAQELSGQEVEQVATILASVAVNNSTVPACNSSNIDMAVLQPPTASNSVTILDGASFSTIPITDPTTAHLSVGGVAGPVVSHAGDVIQYSAGNVTEVIQYHDGSLGQVTTLVPPPPPPPSIVQPVDLLDNVVTVVFESGNGSLVMKDQ